MWSVRDLFFYPEHAEFAGQVRVIWLVSSLIALILLGGYADGYYCEVYGICE